MRATGSPAPTPVEPDHCAVHQFIRLHGRRPSAEELARIQEQGWASGSPSARRPAGTSTRSVRRELARLISRL